MKLTAQIKLVPEAAQTGALWRTLQAANAACDAISRTASIPKPSGNLTSITCAIRIFASPSAWQDRRKMPVYISVCDAYKLDKKTLRSFSLKRARV